ncbi:MAG: hypothetical protein ABIP03_03000, partial [Aquihabitans sp.]
MRMWNVLLALTVIMVMGLLLAPQRNQAGQVCHDVTLSILVSPGYTDGDMWRGARDDTCATAARRRGIFTGALGVAGFGASY